MPTFQSIGMHPDLRNRLVTETRAALDPSAAGDSDEQQQHHQLVLTPQALLSRNPNTLRLLDNNDDSSSSSSSQAISLAQVTKLRTEVATALIAQSGNGRRIERIQKAVSSSSANNDNSIPGMISALDLVRYHKLLQAKATNNSNSYNNTSNDTVPAFIVPSLRTGCRKLDQALALPLEYQSISTQMLPNSNNNSSSSTGIPLGYVTQFSGPPCSGKTQLALHLAAAKTAPLHRTYYLSVASHAPRLAELCHNDYAVLERTQFCHAADEYQVLEHLNRLESEVLLLQQKQQPAHVMVLLILDSCSTCLSTGGDLSAVVAATLRRLTHQYSLATVLLNGTVTNRHSSDTNNSGSTNYNEQRAVKPALGRAWEATADIHVWLEAVDHHHHVAPETTKVKTIRAVVERHSGKPTTAISDSAFFRVTSQGIQDAPVPPPGAAV